MKKLISLIAFAIVAIALPSCTNDKDPEAEGNHRPTTEDNPKIYTYRLSLGGDYIDESEEPLTRSEEAATYVGINVTRKEKGATDTSKAKYAHGVFTDKQNISIELISGYVYEFETSVLEDNTDKYNYDKNMGCPAPFVCKEEGSVNETNYPSDSIGKFLYTFDKNKYETEKDKKYLSQLSSGKASVKVSNSAHLSSGTCAYPRVHRYYGVTSNIDPSNLQSNQTINLNLNYKDFGLCLKIGSIPEGTYLTWRDITVENEHGVNQGDFMQFPQDVTLSMESDESKQWQDTYSLSDLTKDEQKLNLKFTWHKGGGETEEFESGMFTVNAKKRKILKINVDGIPNIPQNGNIQIVLDSSALSDDDEITVSNKK